MRQVLVRSPRDIVLADVEAVALAPDELRIGIAFSGICGSDLHLIRDADRYDGLPTGVAAFGHEYSGTVLELGAAVDGLQVGDRVTCQPRWPCRRCRQCRVGRTSHCRSFRRPERGAWAEQIVVPAHIVHRVPDDVSLRDAALCEPLACALRGIDRAQAPAGHTALVLGAGPIGLLTVALALRSGAREVLVSEPNARRRAIAQELGAVVFDPHAQSLRAALDEHTGGDGADVVYEAVGLGETVAEAVELAAPGGTVVVLGVASPGAVAGVRPWRLFEHELSVVAAWGLETTFGRALDWLRTLDVAPVVTDVMALEDGVKAIALAGGGDCGKVLLAPEGAR